LEQKKALCKSAAKEMDEISKQRVNCDTRVGGKKRKSEITVTTAIQPKKQRIATDMPNPGATTTELNSTFANTTDPSYSLNEPLRLDGHERHSRVESNEYSNFVANDRQYSNQHPDLPPRAVLLSGRTMDWNQLHLTAPQCNTTTVSGHLGILYPQEIASHFAEVVTTGSDRSHQMHSGAGLVDFYPS